MASRFAHNKLLRDRAAKLRAAAVGSQALASMPDSVQGKQLSSFLKDGTLLCGSYQIDCCDKAEDVCGAVHKCAVLLKSGRVCGGRHQATHCREKRFRDHPSSHIIPPKRCNEIADINPLCGIVILNILQPFSNCFNKNKLWTAGRIER